ncbi:Asp23/Gls24 family envelope stress response protein [Streptomyces sp. NPDC047108]|uniref:Asp23/Gls24 family envelope stress response protein n=1 Tax=Streptomyces sp. NPDC047108 TaxID=3155025 RepID=UPI0033E108B0
MTDTTSPPATGRGHSNETGKERQGGKKPRSPEDRGRTTISDSVVEKISAMATREVPGIHSLGAGMARRIGAVRDRVPAGKPGLTRGVSVEVGERQAAVDLDVVVEYGVSISDVAGEVRANVIAAVERMTGLEVVEVNIAVDDVHLPDEEDETSEESEGRVA